MVGSLVVRPGKGDLVLGGWIVAEGFVQAFWLYQATHSAVESSASSMHRKGLPRLISSALHAASTASATALL